MQFERGRGNQAILNMGSAGNLTQLSNWFWTIIIYGGGAGWMGCWGPSPSDKNNIPHVAKVDSQRFSSSSSQIQNEQTLFLQQLVIKFV